MVLALAAEACGSSSEPGPLHDALVPGADAATDLDATELDGSPEPDSGEPPDAGGPPDSGVVLEPCLPLPAYDPAMVSPRFEVGTTPYQGNDISVPLITGDPSSPLQRLPIAADVHYPALDPGPDAPPAAGGPFPVVLGTRASG